MRVPQFTYKAIVSSIDEKKIIETTSIRQMAKELNINAFSVRCLIDKKECKAGRWVSIEKFAINRIKPTFKKI